MVSTGLNKHYSLIQFQWGPHKQCKVKGINVALFFSFLFFDFPKLSTSNADLFFIIALRSAAISVVVYTGIKEGFAITSPKPPSIEGNHKEHKIQQ